jgi:hypothetical protein
LLGRVIVQTSQVEVAGLTAVVGLKLTAVVGLTAVEVLTVAEVVPEVVKVEV